MPKTDSQKIQVMEEFTGKSYHLIFRTSKLEQYYNSLADFTDKNLVASDSVGGNLTLRLKNVPWDQALDIISEGKRARQARGW